MEVKSEKVEQEHNKLGCFKHNEVKKGGGEEFTTITTKTKRKGFRQDSTMFSAVVQETILVAF